jgi:hypothetical protein
MRPLKVKKHSSELKPGDRISELGQQWRPAIYVGPVPKDHGGGFLAWLENEMKPIHYSDGVFEMFETRYCAEALEIGDAFRASLKPDAGNIYTVRHIDGNQILVTWRDPDSLRTSIMTRNEIDRLSPVWLGEGDDV